MRVELEVPLFLSTGGKRIQVTITRSESNPVQGLISVDSPLAKALWRRQIGESVEVRTPKGLVRYEVEAIGELADQAA